MIGALIVCVFASPGCGGPKDPAGFRIAPLPATIKLEPSAPLPERPRVIEVEAARNETEGFQLAIRAVRTNAAACTVRVSPLVHPDGHRLPPDAVRLFRQHPHLVLQPTGGYRWQRIRELPEVLLPFTGPEGAPYGAPFALSRIGATAKPYLRGRQDQAFLFAEGLYTGRHDRSWAVQILHDGPPGEATFRWTDRWKQGWDGEVRGRGWSEPVTIPPRDPEGAIPRVPLRDGVSLRFTSAPGDGWKADDTYHFRTYAAAQTLVWCDLAVPSNAVPGRYTGSVTVEADGRRLAEVPLALEVWPFALPRPRTMATAFHGWMDSRFYAEYPDADWEFELLMHQHGIDLQTIHGQRTIWGGDPDAIDWTAFDAAAAPRLSGDAYPDGVPMKRFHPGFYGPGNEWHWERQAGQSVERVEAFAAAFARHFKQRGWFDRVYLYCRDEPHPKHIPGIVRDIDAFVRGDPDWRGTFMITSAPREDSPLLDRIDIWCVKYHWWIDPALRQRLLDDGRVFWTYVANTPHTPNLTYHLDSRRGYEPRLIKWASWLQGSEGFLYWAAALDQRYPNPWTTAMNDFGANGDANLVYYGARTGPRAPDHGTPLRSINAPLPSFRLKQIRDGLDDWDLFTLAARQLGRETVEAEVRKAYRSPGGGYGEKVPDRELEKAWTQEPDRLLKVRRSIAQQLIAAMKQDEP